LKVDEAVTTKVKSPGYQAQRPELAEAEIRPSPSPALDAIGVGAMPKDEHPPYPQAGPAPQTERPSTRAIDPIAVVGAIGGTLSWVLWQIFVYLLAGAQYRFTLLHVIGIAAWALCGGVAGLLKSRYRIWRAVGIATAAKLIVNFVASAAYGVDVFDWAYWAGLVTGTAWFVISILGIIWLYESRHRKRLSAV
jgi:hypothetical protein